MKYLLILCLLFTCRGEAAVPDQRIAILTRGANITSAFEREANLSGDLSHLSRAGFRHVRVFVDQDTLTAIAHECWTECASFDEYAELAASCTRSLYAAPSITHAHFRHAGGAP